MYTLVVRNEDVTKNPIFSKYGLPFTDTDEFIEFIMEHFDASDFEDSCVDLCGYGDPNEMVKCTVADKLEIIRECLLELVQGNKYES